MSWDAWLDYLLPPRWALLGPKPGPPRRRTQTAIMIDRLAAEVRALYDEDYLMLDHPRPVWE